MLNILKILMTKYNEIVFLIMFSNLFSPRLKLKTIEDLDFSILKKHHFKGLFIDLDNTLIDTKTLEITQERK